MSNDNYLIQLLSSTFIIQIKFQNIINQISIYCNKKI